MPRLSTGYLGLFAVALTLSAVILPGLVFAQAVTERSDTDGKQVTVAEVTAAETTAQPPLAAIEGLIRSYGAEPCLIAGIKLTDTDTVATDHIQLAYDFRWQMAGSEAGGADTLYVDLNPGTGEIYETELAAHEAICVAADSTAPIVSDITDARDAPDAEQMDAGEPAATADWSASPLREADVLQALEGQADGTCAIADLVPAGIEPITGDWVRASYAFRWNVPDTDIWHEETLHLVVDTASGAIDEAELERSYAICWDWR